MKKTYIAPEMEVKTFNVEEIMTASSATTTPLVYAEGSGVNAADKVSYNELFGL